MKLLSNEITFTMKQHTAITGFVGVISQTTAILISSLPEIETGLRILSLVIGCAIGIVTLTKLLGKKHEKKHMKKTLLLLTLTLSVICLSACSGLVLRSPVDIVQKQPDGSSVTNHIPNGYVPGPIVDSAKPISNLFGPYGDAAYALFALGIGAYVRYQNQRELKAHVEATTSPPKTG